jgi:hypothetical protein
MLHVISADGWFVCAAAEIERLHRQSGMKIYAKSPIIRRGNSCVFRNDKLNGFTFSRGSKGFR